VQIEEGPDASVFDRRPAINPTLAVGDGGTGAATLTANAVLLGNGTSPVAFATIGTGGRVLIDQGAGSNPAFTAIGGDATLAANGALTIAANAVTNAKFRQGVARSLVGVTGNATGNVADLQGAANQIPIVNSAGTALAFTSLSGDVTNATGVMTIAAAAVTNAKLANMATATFKGRTTAGTGDPEDLTVTQAAALLNTPDSFVTVAVDFNAANTDHAITIPTRFTKYRVFTACLLNTGATASITTARGGLFPAPAGAGTALIADQALSGLTSNAADTAGNLLRLVAGLTTGYTRASTPTIYWRTSTAQGAAASGTVTVFIEPLA